MSSFPRGRVLLKELSSLSLKGKIESEQKLQEAQAQIKSLHAKSKQMIHDLKAQVSHSLISKDRLLNCDAPITIIVSILWKIFLPGGGGLVSENEYGQ